MSTRPRTQQARTYPGEDWTDLPEPTPPPEETSEEDSSTEPPEPRQVDRRPDYQRRTPGCGTCF